MTSIYITSKKRLDSRWLWITVVLTVILIIAITYIFVKNSQSTSNNTVISNSSSNSSTPESKPVDAMMSISNTSNNLADTNMTPESDKSQNSEVTMPAEKESEKPNITMDELINQSQNR